MHYYKFNIPDWNLGTGHLSLEEEAVYLRLVNFYYDSECPIPIEIGPVLRRLRMAGMESIATQILDEFFTKTEKGYSHKRCELLLKEYKKTIKNNRSNGAKGGRPRKDAACKETQEKPSGFFLETQVEPTHNPNQELLTINHKPITNNQEPINTSPLPPANAVGGEQVKKRKPKKPKTEPTEFEQFVMDEYNRTLGETNGFVTAISDGRAKAIRKVSEIRPNAKNQEWWTKYFEHVSQSQFLTGRATDFSAPFDWMLRPDNVIKIIEGQYHK